MKCNSILAMTLVGTVVWGSAAFAKTCGGGSPGSDNQCPNPPSPPVCNPKPPGCPPKPPACPPEPPVDPPCQGDTTADSTTLFGANPPLAAPPPCCNPVRAFAGASSPSASSTCHALFGDFSLFAPAQSDDD